MSVRDKIADSTELWLPWFAGVFISLLTWFALRHHWYHFSHAPKTTELFTAVVSVTAIAVGFLGTVASILLSLENSKIIKNLKRIGLYKPLIDYIMQAIVVCFLTSIVSSYYILIDDISKLSLAHQIELALWNGLSTLSAATCIRVVYLFAKILYLNAEQV